MPQTCCCPLNRKCPTNPFVDSTLPARTPAVCRPRSVGVVRHSLVLEQQQVRGTVPRITTGATNLPMSMGTVLCDLCTDTFIYPNAPGLAFSIPSPDDCTLAGVPLYAQVASVAGDNVHLTNGLDIACSGAADLLLFLQQEVPDETSR